MTNNPLNDSKINIKVINEELLLLTLQTIIDNPKHWNQEHWHCGSGHCFAGFVQALHMGIDFKEDWPNEIDNEDPEEYATSVYFDILAPNIQEFITSNNIETTCEYAKLALGLDYVSTILFDYSNTLETLKLMVNYLVIHKSLKGFKYKINDQNVIL